MSFLDRSNTIAPAGYNRWLVPPAALAIHLSIGQVYAFSVFKLPLTKLIGITQSAPEDWTQPSLAWIFSLAIFFFGASAAMEAAVDELLAESSERSRGTPRNAASDATGSLGFARDDGSHRVETRTATLLGVAARNA